ncbi:D-lactate dehydrogenase [cytochrome] 1, mitochondrial [Cyphellophora attinorum]|uniref:D-lactate dehydrogenase (cytochrome) n=1 Tax=Cyphellophora attinorum TaxID=1664694 RepID=A0A0N1HKZ5_9EURO|nr:D-lactate dehydrogenase [cytochrome] 1, mitochondrial [Phialophora attinorum]KPI37543.1 D-lactate dehydrogenase [cytochrome] 1, mitochondrial [Phialophora attinorum]
MQSFRPLQMMPWLRTAQCARIKSPPWTIASRKFASRPPPPPPPPPTQPINEELLAQLRGPNAAKVLDREFRRVRAERTPWWQLFIHASMIVVACNLYLENWKLKSDPPRSSLSTLPLSTDSTSALKFNTTKPNIDQALQEFRNFLTDTQIDTNPTTCLNHSSTEWSASPHGDADRYDLILYPSNTSQVSAIAKICHARKIPMTAFSGGTSLEGTLAATNGGVCIDFSRNMSSILAVRPSDLDCTVQPGVSYTDLNELIASQNLYFPVDPGPGAQIGGMVAQGCSGTNAYRYGTMKEWVLGLTVVLADGTIVRTRHRPRKSSAGYDLTRLIVGSEGTLGLVTEAHLKLTSKPENERVAVAAFPSTQAAVATAVKVVQSDMPVAAMELLCDVAMKAVNNGGYCDKHFAEKPTLFFKFHGKDKAAVGRQIEVVRQLAREARCETFEFSKTDEEREAIWAARKTVLWSMMSLKKDPGDRFLSADTAVPISMMGEAVDAAKRNIAESGLIGNCLGHVGDGNFHTSVFYGEQEKEKAREVITWVQRLAIGMEGTITGEHGVGLEYRDMVVEELGVEGVDLMRKVKLAVDPLGLLNPGKMIRMNISGGDDDVPVAQSKAQ